MNKLLQPNRFRNINILVLALFLILLAGAVTYVQERMLFCDASYICFHVLNLDRFCISEHRYGSFITQMFPLIAGKLQLPLSGVILLYSISFNLFYLTVAALLIFRYKNTLLALLMAFYYILFVSHTYFWTNNEIHQATAWMFLFFGFMLHFKNRTYSWWLHLPLFILLAGLSIFTHPLILLVFPFLWFFFLSGENRPYNILQSVLLTLLLAGIVVVKYLLMQESAYDKQKIPGITLPAILNIFSSPMAGIIMKKFISHYYFVPVIFIWGLYSAFRIKKYKEIVLTIGFAFGYFTAVCLTFDSFIPFYHESEWMPFTIIVAAPFVFYTIPRLNSTIATGIIIIIFVTRIVSIGIAGEKFTERKDWIYSTLDQMKKQEITKGYIYTGDEKTDNILMMPWGLPLESIIASTLQGDMSRRTFFADNPEKVAERITQAGKGFVSSFWVEQAQSLNSYYFPVDTSTYQPVYTDR